jgi:hypothetical protein
MFVVDWLDSLIGLGGLLPVLNGSHKKVKTSQGFKLVLTSNITRFHKC